MPDQKKFIVWVTQTMFPPLGAGLLHVLGLTMRLSFQGMERIEDFHRKGQGVIFAFWHGRQLMMPLAYRGKQGYVLISQHRDGELIHRLIQRFGFQSVRGSTTRGGGMAFRHLIRLAQNGGDLVVTPDGPKGPKEVVKPGVIRLAERTGLPIVPVTFACSKKNSSPVGMSSFFLILFQKVFLSVEPQFW